MKELSIEEKAKAYDEAKARMSRAFNSNRCTIGFMNEIFPELKESEDKEIRKELITHCRNTRCVTEEGAERIAKWITWLKRQGEQKQVVEMKTPEESLGISSEEYNKIVDDCILGDDKVKPKFKIGDEIKTTNEEPLTITKIDDKGYWSEDLFICGFDDAAKWELVKQKPWSEEDEKIILAISQLLKDCESENGWDCVYSHNREVFFADIEKYLQSLKNRVVPQSKQEWSEEDDKMCQETIDWFEKKCFPYALENDNPARESIKWLKSLKNRVIPQSKQEWSENTQQWIDAIIKDYEGWYDADKDHRATIQVKINILKSLRPKNTWKPSDEQMVVLELASKYERVFTPKQIGVLIDLKEQLKKLKGE